MKYDTYKLNNKGELVDSVTENLFNIWDVCIFERDNSGVYGNGGSIVGGGDVLVWELV